MYRPERINKDEGKRLIATLLSTPFVIDSDLFLSIMNGIEKKWDSHVNSLVLAYRLYADSVAQTSTGTSNSFYSIILIAIAVIHFFLNSIPTYSL